MMKKNTILKILSFVLVLTMVVAAVLLTGCGNKKEDPKASQEELDAAKAALEAAKAEIEKIQADIDKMTKDGSATADDLKEAQEALKKAQEEFDKLKETVDGVNPQEVYDALYGEDSEYTKDKYLAKVEEYLTNYNTKEYIVDYTGNKDAAFNASDVGKTYNACKDWATNLLPFSTSKADVEKVWNNMKAAFGALQTIAEKFDAELDALLPDADGGKLTLVQEANGEKVDQLKNLKKYYEYIKKTDGLAFKGATETNAEPRKDEYDAIVAAYAKLDAVYEFNKTAYANTVAYAAAGTYSDGKTDAIAYTEAAKKANDEILGAFTKLPVYCVVTDKTETTVKEEIKFIATYGNGTATYTGGTLGNLTRTVAEDGTVSYKLKGVALTDKQTVKEVLIADVFNKTANADAKYYVAVDPAKDLSAYAVALARDARYAELDKAKDAFATVFAGLTQTKKYYSTYPTYEQIAEIEKELETLTKFEETYKLTKIATLSTEELNAIKDPDEKTEATKKKAIDTALNTLNAEICQAIFDAVKAQDSFKNDTFAKNANYARLASIKELAETLTQLKKDYVDKKVGKTEKTLAQVLVSWNEVKVDSVAWADIETYKEVDKILNGGLDEDGKTPVDGLRDKMKKLSDDGYYTADTGLISKVTNEAGTTAAYNKTAFQQLVSTKVNYDVIDNLIKRERELVAIDTTIKAASETFKKDLLTELTDKVDPTGKVTFVIEKDGTKTTYFWDVKFGNSDKLADFDAAIDAAFKAQDLLPDATETTVRKTNYTALTTDAKALLTDATKAFDTYKKSYQDAYDKVKAVIRSFNEETGEIVWTEGKKLQELQSILWAKGIIEAAEEGLKLEEKTKIADVAQDGKFVVETYKNKDGATKEVKYGDFRKKLNTAIDAAKGLASQAAAEAKGIKAALNTKDELTGKTTAEYTSLNQNGNVEDVVDTFSKWCIKYLYNNVKEATYKDKFDEAGKKVGTEPRTNQEFFALVANFFQTANENGSNGGILGVLTGNKNNPTQTYEFVTADIFNTLKTIDANKDAKLAAAKTAFLALLSDDGKLLPESATEDDVDTLCRAFADYVKTYYMPDGDSTDAVWAYYKTHGGIEGVSDATFKQTSVQNTIKTFTANEDPTKRAARYAGYIKAEYETGKTGTKFITDETAGTFVVDYDAYTDFAAFVNLYNTVTATNDTNVAAIKALGYTYIVARDGKFY